MILVWFNQKKKKKNDTRLKSYLIFSSYFWVIKSYLVSFVSPPVPSKFDALFVLLNNKIIIKFGHQVFSSYLVSFDSKNKKLKNSFDSSF